MVKVKTGLFAFEAFHNDEGVHVTALYEGDKAKEFIDDHCGRNTQARLFCFKNEQEARDSHNHWLSKCFIYDKQIYWQPA